MLFNDTVKYNIQYGRMDASDDEVAVAAEAAQIKVLNIMYLLYLFDLHTHVQQKLSLTTSYANYIYYIYILHLHRTS